MKDKLTMARFNKSTLACLGKYKIAPRESYDSVLARILGIKRLPKQFKLKELKNDSYS